jgi:hypothetical protein
MLNKPGPQDFFDLKKMPDHSKQDTVVALERRHFPRYSITASAEARHYRYARPQEDINRRGRQNDASKALTTGLRPTVTFAYKLPCELEF